MLGPSTQYLVVLLALLIVAAVITIACLMYRLRKANARLRAQAEDLERANEVRKDFTANVSHEMKTPLQVISGYSEMISSGMAPQKKTREFASKIHEESVHLQSLIADILILSRMDSAQFENDTAQDTFIPLDLGNLVQRTCISLGSLAKMYKVKLDFKGAMTGPDAGGYAGIVIDGNETIVEHAVSNLIENAIRYSKPSESVSVSVGIRQAGNGGDGAGTEATINPSATDGSAGAIIGEKPNASASSGEAGGKSAGMSRFSVSDDTDQPDMAYVEVADNGIGIDADELPKVFERFYRGRKSRSKASGGTGLGLAIVKHAALYHAGNVIVESSPAHGSTFTLLLPLLQLDNLERVQDEQHGGND